MGKLPLPSVWGDYDVDWEEWDYSGHTLVCPECDAFAHQDTMTGNYMRRQAQITYGDGTVLARDALIIRARLRAGRCPVCRCYSILDTHTKEVTRLQRLVDPTDEQRVLF